MRAATGKRRLSIADATRSLRKATSRTSQPAGPARKRRVSSADSTVAVLLARVV
jgi:hypothetical protein